MRPICASCAIEYAVETCGATVVVMQSSGKPYELWQADVWYCPSCGHEIISGFANNPYCVHYESNFAIEFAKVMERKHTGTYGPVYLVYESVIIRDAHGGITECLPQ